MFKFVVLFVAVVGVGCSSKDIARTRFTDKNMRVMIDPDSLSESDYVRVQKALVENGAFAVIDRGAGMRAIKKEQERLHRDEPDRFSDREKWAHWGRLYGVGAIVVGHIQCFNQQSFWNPQNVVRKCDQFLSLMDANTGEVITAVDGKAEAPAVVEGGIPASPSWDEVVNNLVAHYPKNFEFKPYSKSIVEYQDLSEEHARRQREPSSNSKGE